MRRRYETREISMERIRAYAQELAEMTSLRAVAESAGLGHSTMHNFLHGAIPQRRFRAALAEWYAAEVENEPEEIQDALTILLSGLPVEHQHSGTSLVMGAVVEAYRIAGKEPPSWTGQ